MSTAGLIPAHAGKTTSSTPRPKRLKAHPRSRGENCEISRSERRSAWLIPAHAGKTGTHHQRPPRQPAHPRSRGENSRVVMMVPFRGGSSPLTRGKRYSVHRLTCACGFIPAHAGKTSHDPAHQSASTAHPRSRRENDLTEPIMELMPGSSSLTRGKLDRAAGPGQVVGLIPAHAGKTSCSVEPLGSVGAHPRSRGENGGTRSLRIPARGSSPLTRGKPPGRP